MKYRRLIRRNGGQRFILAQSARVKNLKFRSFKLKSSNLEESNRATSCTAGSSSIIEIWCELQTNKSN